MSQLPNRRERSRFLVIADDSKVHEAFQRNFGQRSADRLDSTDKNAATPQADFDLQFTHQVHEGLTKIVAARAEQRPFVIAFIAMPLSPGEILTMVDRLWEVDDALQVVLCTGESSLPWSELVGKVARPARLFLLRETFSQAELLQLTVALAERWRLEEAATLQRLELEGLVETRTQSLTETQQASERLINAIDSLLIDIDYDGVVRRWNRIAVEMFGILERNAVGRQLAELAIQWEDPSALLELLSPKKHDSVRRKEAAFRDSQGVSRVVGFSCYPIREAEQHQGVLVLGTELTGQRELEQHLHQAQKLEAVGQLASGVAHEINTPMQYVGDNLDFLEKKLGKLTPVLEDFSLLCQEPIADWEPEQIVPIHDALQQLNVKSFLAQVLEAISDSQAGVQHVSRIVRAMKEFAHPGQEEKMPVDINRALESTIAVSTNEWKYVATVETELEDGLPLVCLLPGEMNQVFLNILVNAAHAIAAVNEGGVKGKGVIKISTRSVDDGHVEIAIADTGTGISESVKQKVFDPFFTTKDVGKGTGQGLAIAHSIVEQKHGGRIWCDTTEGSGTTFFLHLPIEAPDLEVTQTTATTVVM